MSAPGYQVPRDPTAVIGVRILAWIVDFALVFGLSLLLSPVGPLGEYVEGADDVNDACEQIRDQDDDVFNCWRVGDRAYFTSGTDTLIGGGVQLIYGVLVFVVWQGATGMTVGKALAGLRTVDENGQPPGLGRAFLRSLLWIVDGQPCGIPAVGFITGLTSRGHRRVGDMAAKTYVVRKGDAGRPIVLPGAVPGYGAAPGYATVPGYGAPAGYGPQQPVGYPPTPPTAGPWGAAPPTAPTPRATPGGAPPGGAPPGWPGAQPQPPVPASAQAPPAGPGGQGGPPTFGAGARPYEGEPPGAPGTSSAPAPPTDQVPTGERPVVSEAPGTGAAPAAEAGTTGDTRPSDTAGPTGGPSTVGATGDTGPSDTAGPTGETGTVGATADRDEVAAGPPPAAAAPSAEPSAETPSAGAEEQAAEAAPAGEQRATAGESRDAAGAPQASQPSQPGAADQAAAPGQTYNPQWDAARGTYIQWDAARGQWLQWDDSAKQWKPI